MSEQHRLPDAAQCVVRELLERRAASRPDADFMLFEDGERWTYADALERVLEHVVGNSGARLMIADGRLVDRLSGVDRGALESVIVLGDERPALPGIALEPEDVLWPPYPADVPVDPPIAPWDTQMVIYTSGTTGSMAGPPSSSTRSVSRGSGTRCAVTRSRRWGSSASWCST